MSSEDKTKVIEVSGSLDASQARVAIVASRFNSFIVERLIEGAVDVLKRVGGAPDSITIVRCPGAFELPAVTRRCVDSRKFDAVICLGAVIRGATPHFDYVAAESSKGIAAVAAQASIPVVFGVLTTDTIEQAVERAGTKAGNKGADAAMTALEMISLYRKLGEGHGSDKR